jgi:hypothetical protein
MCDAIATNREHVPPQCIFPKKEKWRKNLITVPSCDLHNLQKSKNDEILRCYLSAVEGVNYLGSQIATTKVFRGIERRPYLFPQFFQDFREVRVGTLDSAAFNIDLPRFNSSIESVVRGLFYADFEKKLLSELCVVWTVLRKPNLLKSDDIELIQQTSKKMPPMKRGSNPKVFLYDYYFPSDDSGGICQMSFYEGAPICVSWKQLVDRKTTPLSSTPR